MYDVFENFFGSWPYEADLDTCQCGTHEKIDEDTSTLTTEVPGHTKDSLEIEYLKEKQTLYINSKEEDEKKSGYKRMKINKGWKLHKFTDSVEASIENGLLKITLKKVVPAESRPELIIIK